MAITGNASYIPTMNLFLSHWGLCNDALSPAALVVAMPDKTSMDRAAFVTLRVDLIDQQAAIQDKLNDEEIARSDIEIKKLQLLGWLNGFNALLEAYYQKTKFFSARPKAPGIGDGQENFTRPLVDVKSLWGKVNAAPAPAGVTLPLTLADGTTQAVFADAVAALLVAYQDMADAEQNSALARVDRDALQVIAYDAMKSYRLAVPPMLAQHPTLVETLPVLTPAAGHTPDSVNVSGVFEPPDASKVVYGASSDPDLQEYQLRGTVGANYSEEDAVVIDSHAPADPREFVTTFGLTQPGARVSLKVFVVLTTGNEAGSATVVIQRPVA